MMISNIGRLTRDKVRAKVHYSSSFLGSRGIYRVQGCRVIRTVHTRRSKERKHCGVVANDKSKNAHTNNDAVKGRAHALLLPGDCVFLHNRGNRAGDQ